MFKNVQNEIIVDGYMKVHQEFKDIKNLKAEGHTINPIYVEKETMRESTKGIPKFVPMFDKVGNVYRFPRAMVNRYVDKKEYTITDETILGETVDFKSSITLRKEPEDQEKFVTPLMKAVKETYGAVGQASAGTGKTVQALYIVAELQKPTIVVVHKTFLVNQWVERIENFYGIPREEIGIVRQDTCEYEGKKIVIALVQSLLSREYPEDFYNHFGILIFDEVHRFGADTFRQAIPMFKARYRIGLTATPERRDKQESVVYGHIGPIKSVLIAKGRKPEIHFVNTPVMMDTVANKRVSSYGKINLAKLTTYLGEHEARTNVIVDYIMSAVKSGRKIIVLSGRRKHLETMRELIKRESRRMELNTTVAFYVGGMTEKELKIAENHQVLLGTLQMAKEGLDIPDLDTLFLTTPISEIEQAVGRILRFHEDKKQPMVIDFIDNVGICHGMANKRRKEYLRLGYDVKN